MEVGRIVFETARMIVRHYEEQDEEYFFLLNSHPDVMRYIRPVKTREDTASFFRDVLSYSRKFPLYGRMAVIEKSSGQFIGSFAVIPMPGSDKMQMGYSFFPAYWGRGLATEIVRKGLDYIFTETSLTEIYGVTELMNTASRRVLLKAGFMEHSRVTEDSKELARFVFLKSDYPSFSTGSSPV